ncbi:MAG: hypothetical protein K2J20_04445 [Bacilli bacterium]|nr:hypothetical protein [Bacilli bacterium]
MKKNRNAFFQESQTYSNSGFPNPSMNIANGPFTMESYANQSFYAGPSAQAPLNYNIPATPGANYNSNDYSDIESRLSKIERQINRMEARINKLESGTFYTNEDIDTTNNVYMV